MTSLRDDSKKVFTRAVSGTREVAVQSEVGGATEEEIVITR